MKKIWQAILMMILSLTVTEIRAQILFPEEIQNANSSDALVDQEQVRGTHWFVADEPARDNIPVDKRHEGMIVTHVDGANYVTNRYDNSSVTTINWTANANWNLISTFTKDSLETYLTDSNYVDRSELTDSLAPKNDTLNLHRQQITSILSDLDTKLEVTDTINYSDTSFVLKLSDGKVVDDSTDFEVDTVDHSITSDTSLYLDDLDAFTNFEIPFFSAGELTSNSNFFLQSSNFSIPSQGNIIMGNLQTGIFNTSGNRFKFQLSDDTTFISYQDSTWFNHLISVASGGIRLPDGYLIASESDLGTGGSSDSSSITYEVDTAKAFNNSDIFFNPDITAGNNIIKGNGQLKLYSQEGTNLGTNIQLSPAGTGNSSGRVIIEVDQTRFSSSDVWVDVLRADDLGDQFLTLASASSGSSVRIRPDGSGSATAQTEFSTTLLDVGTDANFDSTVTLGSSLILSDGYQLDGEPDIVSTIEAYNDTAGVVTGLYGQLYRDSTTASITLTDSEWINANGWTLKDTLGVDVQGDSALVVQTAGTYEVELSNFSFSSSEASTDLSGGISINDANPNMSGRFRRTISTADIYDVVDIKDEYDLSQGDVITLKLYRISGTGDITALFGNLRINKIR